MFSTKRLTAIACAWALAGAAQAQQNRPAAPGTQPVSARVPAVDIDMGSPSKAGSAVVKAPPAVSQPVASRPDASHPVAPQPVSASTTGAPHLSIDDIDQITRSKIARQLAGEGGQQGGVAALNAPAPVPASAPASAPVVKVVAPSPHGEPVRFVGAFSDTSGTSVLYEYRDASYPARVGAKLLNGWTVKRVDGFVVTVAEGKRTWTETISGGTPATVDSPRTSSLPVRSLNDLGGPLPPAIPLSAMGQ